MSSYSTMPSVTDGMVELSNGVAGPVLDKDRLFKSIFRISNLLTIEPIRMRLWRRSLMNSSMP